MSGSSYAWAETKNIPNITVIRRQHPFLSALTKWNKSLRDSLPLLYVSTSQELFTTEHANVFGGSPSVLPRHLQCRAFYVVWMKHLQAQLVMISQTAVWSSVLFLRKERCAHFLKFNWTDSEHYFHTLTACFFFSSISLPSAAIHLFFCLFSSSAEPRAEVLLSELK